MFGIYSESHTILCIFRKRFIFLKDSSPEAETPDCFLKISFQAVRPKKKFECTNLEGSLSILSVEECTVHEDSHEES